MARERVLVADDEPTIRFTIGEHLQSLGYEVEQAAACWTEVSTRSVDRRGRNGRELSCTGREVGTGNGASSP